MVSNKIKKILNTLFIIPCFILVSSVAYPFWQTGKASDTVARLEPAEQYAKEAMLVTQILERYHYRKVNITDSLSSVILGNYLSSLDPNKAYFLASDIEKFERFRYELDDNLKNGILIAPYYIFNIFKKRFYERSYYIDRLLETKFDFTIDEYYDTDRSDDNWPETYEEQNDLWRKIIKAQALNMKLAGKELGEALGVLNKRYQRYEKVIRQYTSEDVFQQFMNAFSESYDPHTNYFSPISSENFMINQSLSLEGIGARLTNEGDFTIIADIVAGGPAYKSKQLHENDKIVGVAQGNEKFTDVIGWRVTDVVQLIRGPKGTVVRLQIIPAGESINTLPVEVKLVREKIRLEDEKVKSEVIPVHKNGKDYEIGVITVPSFYLDIDAYRKGDKNYNSTSKDVKTALENFKDQGVDGVLVDLRRNGGGSLQEAIEMSGLFIKNGPVVQVRNSNGGIELGEDPDPKVVYDGPLAVLINRFSASASEIFAGAIQDYERGLIIGEQSYGKGTVQNLIDLDRFLPDEKEKLGQLKMTMAKFYRVSGSSTQHKGVNPDIELPSAYSADIFGESSKPSALPWDKISSTGFKQTNKISDEMINRLKKTYEKRKETDQDLIELIADIEEARENRAKTMQSLEESKRKKEIEEAEKRRAARSKLSGTILSPETGESREDELKLNDTYLKEGVLLLADLIAFMS